MKRLANITRRHVLRGLLGGTAVSVALPLLDCFLDGNGTALASGAPLPVRFGTWGWGLGMTEALFVPQRTGASYDLPEEIAALAPVQRHINLFTGFNAFTDGAPRFCHYTGWVLLRSGGPPRTRDDLPGETIDVTVARRLGTTTRFPSLTLTATGDIRDSFSYENRNSVNAAEWSPLALYQRLFGPDFQDPNAAAFTPDPRAMIRRSVLSGVLDDTRRLERARWAPRTARGSTSTSPDCASSSSAWSGSCRSPNRSPRAGAARRRRTSRSRGSTWTSSRSATG